MRKRWTLVVVFAALAALVGAYFLVRARPASTSQTPPSTSVELAKLDKDKVVKVVLTSGNGVLTAVKKDKTWKVDYPYPIVLNESNMDDLAYAVSTISAERVIEENPADLAQYGLKPPRVTAQAVLEDGTTKVYYLGDKTPTGSYYFQVKDDPKVYSVWMSIGEHFHWTVSDLREKKIVPEINGDEVRYLLVKERGVTVEIKEKTEEESKTFQLGFGKYMLTRPYRYPVGLDTEKADSIIKGPSGLQISDFVNDDPKSLAPYGLNAPWGECTVRDKANTVSFLFGANQGTDKIYFKIAGRPNVYTVEKSLIAFMDLKPFDLIDKFAFIPNIEDVDRIEIAAGGATHALVLTRTVKKAEKEGDPDETVTTYTADGKDVEESTFKGFYQILIGLQIEGEAEKSRSGAPDVTTRFFFNKGATRQVVVSYVPYDKDFDAILVNGLGEFAISKQQLDTMLSNLEKMLRGEKVKA